MTLTEDHLLAIEAGARGGALDAAVALELCAEVRRLRRVERAARVVATAHGDALGCCSHPACGKCAACGVIAALAVRP